jgi:hypothetical protein
MRRLLGAVVVVAAAVVAIPACGGVTAGAPDEGSSTGGLPVGYVSFTECSGGMCSMKPQFVLDAAFASAGFAQAQTGATLATSDACAAYDAYGTSSGASGSTSPPIVSAGTLTLSGGTMGTGVTLAPGDGPANPDFYAYNDDSTLFFSAGQTLTVSASGATVPAFGPESIVAAALPVLVAPTPVSGFYRIPTSADLVVEWTGGQAGGTFTFSALGADGTRYLSCEWPALLGQGTIPRAILAPFAGTSNDGASIQYQQQVATTFTAGEYTISVTAQQYGTGQLVFE